MKILAGIAAHSPQWEMLLKGEGIPFRVVDLTADLNLAEFSVLVIPRLLAGSEAARIQDYLRSGGAVLGAARHLTGVHGISTRREPLEYILSDGDDIFRSVWLMDLALQGDVAREANHLHTQQNAFAVFAGELAGGVGVLFPFDVAEAMADERAVAKAFYSKRERLPSERVSLASKGEVQHLVHDALAYVHRVRNIPYVHLWYYPGVAKNVFAFRVDTDAASRVEIDVLYDAIRQSGIRATWFLDVHSHESWIQHFEAMIGQEIGIHCYDHVVLEDLQTALHQLGRAKKVVEAVGLVPEGFAAPFGVWNHALACAIEQLGFSYSSEFGFAHDALPLHVRTRDVMYPALQVPIHPVSIGSLLRVGYPANAMMEYFDWVIRSKLSRHEPLFFYHHPGHHQISVIEHLLASAAQEEVVNMTLREYARWWNARSMTPVFLEVRGSELHVEPADELIERNLGLRVTLASGKETTVLAAPIIDLQLLSAGMRSSLSPPPDLRRMRESDPRRMLGDLYNAMLRRLR